MTIYSPIQHIWRPCSFWAQQSAFSYPWSNFENAEIWFPHLCQPTKPPQIHFTTQYNQYLSVLTNFKV